jgi:NADPH:quinone reductase-like Zn-dependent oxidoreductase
MEKPTSMFAWQHTSSAGGVDKHLKYAESVPPPQHLPNSVFVKVLRTSLNPVDYKMHEMPLLNRYIGHPATLGSDFVGRVVESEGVAGYESGDLVVGKLRPLRKHGTLGEYVIVRPGQK